jgi:transposase
VIVDQAPSYVATLMSHVDRATNLPEAVRLTYCILVETLRFLGSRIEQFDIEITRRAKEDEVTRRLTTIPGRDR